MFPIRDDIPSRRTPIVNVMFIVACTLAFLAQLADQRDGRATLIEKYGMIPARTLNPDLEILKEVHIQSNGRLVKDTVPIDAPKFSPWWNLLTCIFLHGSWMHFGGNMWFLWIFGDNVEDRLGHIGYFIFYLLAGCLASVAHLYFSPDSTIPTIGASGAIAGVMGAYMLLYPRAKVLSVVPIVFIIQMLVLPAPIFLGIWFVLQLMPGIASMGGTQSGGVAWWAHIGGFVVGFAIAGVLRLVGETSPPVEERRHPRNRINLMQRRNRY